MTVVWRIAAALFFGAATLASQAHPVPSPIPGSQLVQTSIVDGPLEVRSATADAEAVLAGLSYEQRSYRAPDTITVVTFVQTYRDALFAAGWKLIEVPPVDNVPPPEGLVNISAHYMENGRNIYARLSRHPDGSYQINVANVGDEDWAAILAKECRLAIPSLHFDLDRPTLREHESAPTLAKLANLLKSRNAPAVEIEGHADNVGEAGVAFRQTLSEARAKTVATWLVAHGVAGSKVTSQGYGKTRPIAENDTDLGRALNRRIEVACLSN
jgi:outer membrane protein OmpA-like peptidoglycan-associated protein